MRKKRDIQNTLLERQKIEQFEDDIQEKNLMLEKQKNLSNKIERKVKAMKTYEAFLERVKEANPDEFSEL